MHRDGLEPPTTRDRLALQVFGALRDGWLVLGISLALFLSLELAYRAQAWVRHPGHGPGGGAARPPHPNQGLRWWHEWEIRDGVVNGSSRYDPYRGWWAEPFVSRYVNVDSAGRRRTVNLSSPAPKRPVYFLGGSVMWGYTVRDSFTIPSLVAGRLRDAGLQDIEVYNLAQPSFNATQGLVTLLLEIRAGRIPAAVVSLDGNNDVLAYSREGMVGAMLGQSETARYSPFGWRGLGANLLGLFRYSALVQRLVRAFGPPRARGGEASAHDAGACTSIAAQYRQIVLSAEALGSGLGFDVLYFWQPHWATTGKRLTPWEQSILGEGTFPALMRRCTQLADSALADQQGRVYWSLTDVFDRDTGSVFLDEFGHVTERGDAEMAERIAALLVARLRRTGISRTADGLPGAAPGRR